MFMDMDHLSGYSRFNVATHTIKNVKSLFEMLDKAFVKICLVKRSWSLICLGLMLIKRFFKAQRNCSVIMGMLYKT